MNNRSVFQWLPVALRLKVHALVCGFFAFAMQLPIAADAISPPTYSDHDYYGAFRGGPADGEAKYKLFDLGKVSADDKPQIPRDENGKEVVFPKQNSGNYHISTTPRSEGDLRLPAFNSVTYGTNPTNLLPSNLTNQDAAFMGYYYSGNQSYGAVTPSTDIVGVTPSGMVIGKLTQTRFAEGWVKPGDTSFQYQNPYPTQESPAFSTQLEVFFAYDTNTQELTKLKDYDYSWKIFGQYFEKTPSQVVIQGYNDRGEFVGMSERGYPGGQAVYYSSKDSSPELLQMLFRSTTGTYSISDLIGIDEDGVIYGVAKKHTGSIGRQRDYLGIDHYFMLVPYDESASVTEPVPVPVPEPSTWIIGLGMIAAVALKRSRK